jgi:PAS domain S-box-containing protein
MDDIETLKKENLKLKNKNFILEQSLKQTYSIQSKLERANSKLLELKNSLYQKEHYINSVVESSQDAIVVINKDFEIKTFNKSAVTLFGYTQKEMINQKNLNLLIPSEYLEIYKSVLKRYFDSARLDNKIETKKIKCIKKSGDIFSAKVSIGLNIDIDNKLVVVNIEDLSLQEEEEREKQRKEKILIQQSKMSALGELIGAIAHQWRQPLNSTALMIQALQEQYLDNELDEETLNYIVDNCMEQINNMSNTIEDFRSFFAPNKEKDNFCMKSSIEKSIAMLKTQLSNHNTTINISGKEICIIGYENEFQQVILNIISNSKDAIFAIQEENSQFCGKIDILLENNDNYTITIRDNGGGIPQDILDRIYEPYFTTKDEGKGTGVGMYMSKIIIENSMNGKINVKNIENGTEVKIIFNK